MEAFVDLNTPLLGQPEQVKGDGAISLPAPPLIAAIAGQSCNKVKDSKRSPHQEGYLRGHGQAPISCRPSCSAGTAWSHRPCTILEHHFSCSASVTPMRVASQGVPLNSKICCRRKDHTMLVAELRHCSRRPLNLIDMLHL
jgi:hypothetical protein